MSAAGSVTAARRAARLGVGIVLDSLSTPQRCRQLVDAYRAAGGAGPCVLIRRAWIGEPPSSEMRAQVATYRSYAPSRASASWGADEMAAARDPADVAALLVDTLATAGADALNLRIHVPGVSTADARDQIERLGEAVVPSVRAAL